MNSPRITSGPNTYHVDAANQIHGAEWPPSGQWLLLGAVEQNNFGRITKHYTVADIRAGRVPWKFKNGKQRCFIKDLDHGTMRVWACPPHVVTSETP